MKILISGLLVCLFICTSPITGKASHIAGTEFSYKCTGTPGIFEVTCILYVRCTGGSIAICNTPCSNNCGANLAIYGADSGYSNTLLGTFQVQLQDIKDVDQKPTCPNIKNVCNHSGCITSGTFSPGNERYLYKGLVNLGPTSGLPSACCNVRIAYHACCRSSYSWGGDYNYYNDITLNRCLITAPCNNSPVFKNEPRIVIIAGQNYINNWGATDPDHDSLSYSFAPAYTKPASGAPGSVLYSPPFAFDRPFPWTGSATGTFPNGIHCDPVNGDVRFTPPGTGSNFSGTICIAVNEWKTINGVPTVISTVRRDIEMTVSGASAPNTPPRFITNPSDAGQVNVPKTKLLVCAGEQLCFTITAKDTDINLPWISDTTFLRWDSSIANLGATFLPDYDLSTRHLTGPREDRYQFCWTPADSAISSIPYYFTVNAMDKRCPIPGELTQAFSIMVMPKVSAQIVKTVDPCQKAFLSYTNLTPSVAIPLAIWKIAKEPNDSLFTNGHNTYIASTNPAAFLFNNPGRYFLQLMVSGEGPNGTPGCLKTYMDHIDITAMMLKDSIQSSDLTCALFPSGKIAVKGYNSVAPYQYKINNLPYTFNTVYTNLMAGKHIVWVKDGNGCEKTDTVILNQPDSLVNSILFKAPTCHNDSNGSIIIQTTGGKVPYTFRLNHQPFQTDSAFRQLASGIYQITVKDSNACIKTDTFILENPAAILAKYNILSVSCFNGHDGQIHIVPESGKQPYRFQLNREPAQHSPLFENLKAGAYMITLTDSALCSHSDSVTIEEPTVLSCIRSKTAISCYNASNGIIDFIPSGGTSPYLVLFDSVLYPVPSTIGSIKPGIYHYQLTDSKGCSMELTDSFENPQQIIAGPISGDTSVTVNSTHTYTAPFQSGLSSIWTVAGGTLLSTTINPTTARVRWDTVGAGHVGILVNSSLTCGDTALLEVQIGSTGIDEITGSLTPKIYPNPVKSILNIRLQKLPGNKTLQLYDIHGRLLIEQELKLQQQLNLESLAPGMYFMKIGTWYGHVVKE